MNLNDITDEIIGHAEYGFNDKGQRVKNDLPPGLRSIVYNRIHGLLIASVQTAEAQVAQELTQFRQFLPVTLQPQFDLSVARVAGILHNTYK